MQVRLPPYVFEDELPSLLATVWQPLPDGTLALDFSRVKYYTPAAITMLITRIDHAMRMGLGVELHGLEDCENLRYLQRIDFFDKLGLKLPEHFTRHNAENAFVPLREVVPGPVSVSDDPLSSELAKCVADSESGDVYLLSQYSLGEIIANLKQHACERGFVCAQYTPKSDLVRIGLADSGIGIRQSFRDGGAPNYREEMTDLQVLDLAMSLWGSSKAHKKGAYGASQNRGVGLTITRFMVAESYGHFFIASGSAWWFRDGLKDPVAGTLNGTQIQGAVLSLGYQRHHVNSYLELRAQAWEALGLTKPQPDNTLFT